MKKQSVLSGIYKEMLCRVNFLYHWSDNHFLINKMLFNLAIGVVKSGQFPLPKIQREFNEIIPTKRQISYHTFCSQETNLNLSLKISPFKYWFTLDTGGFSGFGAKPSKAIYFSSLTEREVNDRAQKFLFQKNDGKYPIANGEASHERKIIICEQLDSDIVSNLRSMDDEALYRRTIVISDTYGLPVYVRPHPKSTRKHRLPISRNIEQEIMNDSIFISHNSGLMAEIIAKGGLAYCLADSEFLDKKNTFELINQAIENPDMAKFDLSLQWMPYFSRLVHVDDQITIDKIVAAFLGLSKDK